MNGLATRGPEGNERTEEHMARSSTPRVEEDAVTGNGNGGYDPDAAAEDAFNAQPDAEVGEAAGQSIENLAEQQQPEGQEPLEGDNQQLTLIAGGEEPTGSSIHLRGGAVPLEGSFDKGQIIELIVRARVHEIDFIDMHDKFGNIIGTERKHVARAINVRRSTTE